MSRAWWWCPVGLMQSNSRNSAEWQRLQCPPRTSRSRSRVVRAHCFCLFAIGFRVGFCSCPLDRSPGSARPAWFLLETSQVQNSCRCAFRTAYLMPKLMQQKQCQRAVCPLNFDAQLGTSHASRISNSRASNSGTTLACLSKLHAKRATLARSGALARPRRAGDGPDQNLARV
jgi:hypothetical protein